jgi:hypothetical protein
VSHFVEAIALAWVLAVGGLLATVGALVLAGCVLTVVALCRRK